MASPFLDSLLTRKGTPAALFDATGVGAYQQTTVLITNAKQVPLRGARGDAIGLTFPSTVSVTPGAVLMAQTSPAGDWYVVVRTLIRSRGALYDRGTTAYALALPATLMVERAVPTAPAGSPRRFDNSGAPLVVAPATDAALVTTTTTIHAGLSTDLDIRQDKDGAGPVVTAILTAYTPLGAAVAEGDVVTVPRTVLDPATSLLTTTPVRYRVANAQDLADADGSAWGRQLMLHNLI